VAEQGVTRPAGLHAAGKRLWDSVVGEYELDPGDLPILAALARTTDELERLTAEVAKAPLTVPGSMGQPVSHPLLSEVRAHRVLQAKLRSELALPSQDDEPVMNARQRQAKAAAQRRWRDAAREKAERQRRYGGGGGGGAA